MERHEQSGYRCFTFFSTVPLLASHNFFQLGGLWLKPRKRDLPWAETLVRAAGGGRDSVF